MRQQKQKRKRAKSKPTPGKSVKGKVAKLVGEKHLRVRQEIEELQSKFGAMFGQIMAVSNGFEKVAGHLIQIADNQDKLIAFLHGKFPDELNVVSNKQQKEDAEEKKKAETAQVMEAAKEKATEPEVLSVEEIAARKREEKNRKRREKAAQKRKEKQEAEAG